MYDQMIHDQNFLLTAIDVVLAWGLSEESFANAVTAQACLMAGNYYD
jgi:hypothetical protein